MLAATEPPERPSAMDSRDALVELGRVARPHGTDGALLVALHGDDPQNLLNARELFLDGAPGVVPMLLDRAEDAGPGRDGRARVRVWLAGLPDRERAELWKGARVCVPELALAELPDGEFYWRDILGAVCRLPDGARLGTLEEIWPTASHDVLVVRDGRRTVLLPATDGVIVRLDREARELWIDPPAGLLDSPDSEDDT